MKKKIIVIVVVIAFLLIISLVYFGGGNSQLKHTIKVSGNIEATETRLSFQVSGKIRELFVDEGYYIKKGQVIATLDKDELSKIAEQAKANLELARADYQLREKDYARYDDLFKDDAVSAQERDIAQNNFQAAKAKRDAAQKELELAGIRLSYADLVSTVNGFVIVKSAEVGEVVQPGSTIFIITDSNDIWLTAYIKEADLGKVKLNQDVDIKTDSYPDKVYKGKVSFISEEAEFTPKYIQTTEERVKLVYRIKIDINNPNFELKPGMPADGYIKE
jgi:HlyD family secretion protein